MVFERVMGNHGLHCVNRLQQVLYMVLHVPCMHKTFPISLGSGVTERPHFGNSQPYLHWICNRSVFLRFICAVFNIQVHNYYLGVLVFTFVTL